MDLKHVLFMLALASLVVYGTGTRELVMKKAGGNNVVGMMNEEHVDCWSSLMELRSCSNEIVLYFTNGEADIGPECCSAITVITHNCWPALLTSLGFTPDEAHYLRGYCDASATTPALSPAL